MSPPEAAKRLCTFDDVLAAGDERAVEVIETVRAEPFDSIEISVSAVLGR